MYVWTTNNPIAEVSMLIIKCVSSSPAFSLKCVLHQLLGVADSFCSIALLYVTEVNSSVASVPTPTNAHVTSLQAIVMPAQKQCLLLNK